MSTQTLPTQQQQQQPAGPSAVPNAVPAGVAPTQQAPMAFTAAMPPMVAPGMQFYNPIAPGMTPAPATGVALWVGNLSDKVDESALFNTFSAVSKVLQVKVVRDRMTQTPRGYGYVNYPNKEEADKAITELNHKKILDKTVRIMYAITDKSKRSNPAANVYVKNLPLDVDTPVVETTFSKYGKILSCYVPIDDETQKCLGYGYVQFETEAEAKRAIEKANKKKVKGMRKDGQIEEVELVVELYKPKGERSGAQGTYTNVFVKNIPEEYASEEKVKEFFSKFGEITMTCFKIHENKKGEKLPFCFLNFKNHDDAVKAVNEVHGSSNGTSSGTASTWYVGRAQSKTERKMIILASMKSTNLYKNNLFVGSLSETTTEDGLRDFFKNETNNIVSVKIPRDLEGKSKGYGYVAFSTPEELMAAASRTDKILDGATIYINIHKSREARQAEKMQSYFMPQNPFAHMTPQQMMMMQMMQMQQFRNMMPMAPQMRARPPMQQQFRPRFTNMNMGAPQQQPQQRGARMVPTMQQQMPSQQQMPLQQQPMGAGSAAFASELSSKDRDEQRRMLGERLYPLVEKIDQARAPKITGMLLDVDVSTLLDMIDHPETLAERVSEAQKVLGTSSN